MKTTPPIHKTAIHQLHTKHVSGGVSCAAKYFPNDLQVAQFLGDAQCVRTLSEQVARTLRNAVRDLCCESASSANEALSCLPGLGASASLTADTASTCPPAVITECSSAVDGPDLCTVLEQLSLGEMLAFPEHVREAALIAHRPQHCLQLTVERGPFCATVRPCKGSITGAFKRWHDERTCSGVLFTGTCFSFYLSFYLSPDGEGGVQFLCSFYDQHDQ